MFSDSVIMYTNIADNYTVSGHVVGMLDRDQRTAKLWCEDCCQSAVFSVFHKHRHRNYVHPRDSKFSHEKINHQHYHIRKNSHSSRSRKSSYLWNTLRRLQQALIAGIYLLSLVSVPCSLSAPTRLDDMGDSNQSQPKWINPCGMDVDGALHDINIQLPKASDLELLTTITNQARIALNQADQFKEDFASQRFNTNFDIVHQNWKDSHYTWLPDQCQIPKNLSEKTPEEHLQSLQLDEALLNTYQYLQMVAVGLEQVVWDQERDNAPLLRSFNESEYNLRLVLCEIQMAIYERGIYDQRKPDVTRDSMPDNIRNQSDSTNLRDWIIYRDYMNALEYVIDVFEHFKPKP